MKPLIAAALAASCLAACAKNPDAIPAISMPTAAYSGMTCEQLATEYIRASTALAQVETQQRQAATGDAVGVFLIGVPLSSLGGGDKEGLVAQYKGEVLAIGAKQKELKCF